MTIVYHWWHEAGDPPPYANLRSPLILSIATTRAHHPDADIVVLNGTDESVSLDWGGFDKKLGFQTYRKTHALKDNYRHRPGWKHLSRLFDIDNFIQFEDVLVYQDVDVFWLKSMQPFSGDLSKFSFNGNNSGYFYYKRSSPTVQQFFEIFRAYTITALNDDSFRCLHRQYVNYNQWYYVLDETMLNYMYHKHRDLFHIISPEEHIRGGNLGQLPPSQWRMLHLNGIMVKNPIARCPSQVEHSRGLACLLLKELYDSVCKTLDQKDLERIFTKEELDGYLPMQKSLHDPGFLERFINTRSDTGHLHLFQACS